MSVWKNKLRLGLMTVVVLVCVGAVAMAALSYPFITTTTDSVRLRRSASLKSTVLETIPSGGEIEVLDKTGSFYKVEYLGRTGYVAAEYVNTDSSAIMAVTAEPVETVSSYPYETVTREKVNLRQTKSVRGTLLKKIPKGATISVLSNGGTWAEVEYNGTRGYVKNEYIVLKEVKKVKVTPTPTPVPTLSPEESASEYQVLQKGSEGSDVKALQMALIELGFLNGTADGKFGTATENAVLLFQQANDYPTTGVADANLQAFIYSGKPKNSKGTATKVNTLSPVSGSTMKLNSVGDAVSELQTQLTALGYYTGEITGKYDSATKKAVIAFQKANGLTADGIAGSTTQAAIASGDALQKGETASPSPTPTATPAPTYTVPTVSVRKGDSGEAAKTVQSRLKELGYYKGRVDGNFGTQSVNALKAFQKANGLTADGVAGTSTYEVLFAENTLAKDATPTPEATATLTLEEGELGTPVEASYETLRQGMSGENVALLQQALIDQGYLSGEPDGIYGKATTKAVKAFQKKNGLQKDGTAGPITLELLYSGAGLSATATATPNANSVAATATPAPTSSALQQGSRGNAVKELQQKLIKLGYLDGKADGVFGAKTYEALVAFQKANKLKTDGIAGTKTLAKLNSSSVVAADSGTVTATTTATPVKVATTTTSTPTASQVQYANWYTTVKAVCKKYPYATVYDYQTGISWQVHIFSVGAHADVEPLTANDTSKMKKVFGGNTWNARAVWVVFSDGSVYMASTHSMPHGTQHISDNNFEGHTCIHFPRTQVQVEAIGKYATSHQETIDAGWKVTQSMK